MKSLQKLTVLVTLITFFASCQSGADVNQTLSKTETRMEMMNKIADDSSMSKEMMAAMMNGKNGKMMMMENGKMPMMENHEAMMKMMKDNPGMMHTMIMNMMEASKSDTSMMSGMCKKMMENPQMMDMMQKMKGKNIDMNKMEGMDKK